MYSRDLLERSYNVLKILEIIPDFNTVLIFIEVFMVPIGMTGNVFQGVGYSATCYSRSFQNFLKYTFFEIPVLQKEQDYQHDTLQVLFYSQKFLSS